MKLAKVLFPFLLLSVCLNIPAGAYETDRIVPSGPNPDEPPEFPPSPKKPTDLMFKRLALTIRDTFDSHANVNRLVPTGPNPQQPPDSPYRYVVDRVVPTGPNPQQSPDFPSRYVVDRVVPTGPNPEQSPDTPSRPFESQFNGFEHSPPAF